MFQALIGTLLKYFDNKLQGHRMTFPEFLYFSIYTKN